MILITELLVANDEIKTPVKRLREQNERGNQNSQTNLKTDE